LISFTKPGNEMVVAHLFELKGQIQNVKEIFVDDGYIVIHCLKRNAVPSQYGANFVDVLDTQTAELLHSIPIDRSDIPVEGRIIDFNYMGGKLVVAYGRAGFYGPPACIK
jgi:hypothetical protein